MPEESSPIKDLLFDHIRNSPDIPRLLSEKRFDLIIRNIMDGCGHVVSMGDEAAGTLATGMLHYLLTGALIPSQRKVEYMGVGVDIVIPDIRTLEKDPKKALLICIPMSSDAKTVRDRISVLNGIQPVGQNIWVVLARDMPVQNRRFVLSGGHEPFSDIIFEISRFVSLNGTGRFRIMQA